jgi:hypothetical protein
LKVFPPGSYMNLLLSPTPIRCCMGGCCGRCCRCRRCRYARRGLACGVAAGVAVAVLRCSCLRLRYRVCLSSLHPIYSCVPEHKGITLQTCGQGKQSQNNR